MFFYCDVSFCTQSYFLNKTGLWSTSSLSLEKHMQTVSENIENDQNLVIATARQ